MSENAAKRNIKTGTQYEKYFKPFCNTSFLGYGNTDLSISIMAKWAKKYKHQTTDLALDHFSGLSLQDTCNAIYQWAHDHFQYKLDGADQQIRSPYCSWLERKTGIDCKSYSVLCGTILDNLGINYYFKKIRQYGDAPGEYSHVYIQVPTNQQTNKQDQYYIIDATIHQNIELPYLEAKTKLMSSKGLKHYGLGRPALGTPNQLTPFNVDAFTPENPFNIGLAGYHGLAGEQNILDDIGGFFEDLDFNNLFNSIDCIGGTAFNDNVLRDLIPKITDYYLSIADKYNQAILNKNWSIIDKSFVDFYVKRHAMSLTYAVKKASKNWNSCSDSSFEFVQRFLNNKIHGVLGTALNAHLQKYFNVGSKNKSLNFTQPAHSGDMFDGVQLWGAAIPTSVTSATHSYSSNVTPKQEQIPAFTITPEIEAALNSDVNSSAFNVNSFLTTLANTAIPIYDTVTGNGNTAGSNNNPITDNSQLTDPEAPQEAGFSWLQVGLLSAAAYGAWQYSKNNKKATK